MKITFLGGTETVTGSKYLLTTERTRVLIDCGLFQGYKWLRKRNWEPLPLDIDKLDAVLLTHAHLDHSGYIPVLYKQGYRGPVFTHHATKDLCAILLPDSGHIQEEDAKFYKRHKISKHENPQQGLVVRSDPADPEFAGWWSRPSAGDDHHVVLGRAAPTPGHHERGPRPTLQRLPGRIRTGHRVPQRCAPTDRR